MKRSVSVKLFRLPYLFGNVGESCKFAGESQRDGTGGPAVPSGRAGWHGGEIGRGLRDPRLVIALEIWIRPRRIARNALVRHIFLDNQTIGAD